VESCAGEQSGTDALAGAGAQIGSIADKLAAHVPGELRGAGAP